MPAARGVKRAASKSTTSAASTGPKNKKKRGAIQLEIPTAPKKRGRVLACGQGDVGQLGLGEDVVETTKFKHVTGLGDKIVDVCAGGMHTIALDSAGKVWTFGCNDEGALGRATSSDTDEGRPRAVSLPGAAVAVCAGDSHSAALLQAGEVYAWGAFRDSHGSMGLVMSGREGKSCRDPVKVDIGEQAVSLASGGDHLVILSTSGNVYTMGCGEQGQLGRLSQRSASRDARQGFSALLVPGKVTLKGGASRVWAGYHATFILDANGEKMLAWGLNNYGQLGITGEKRKGAIFSPTECDAFNSHSASWTRVSCGQHHSIALDSDGHVFAIGRCEYGRLGLGDRSGDAETLEAVPKLQNKKCVSISAGTSNSFAVTDKGEVLSWGMGSEGQLGTGAAADAAEPTAAVLPDMAGSTLHVSAGGQHTVLLNEGSGDGSSPEPQRQQEEEISSTSAPPAPEAKPQKVNGDEKETAMEVDETDKEQEPEKKDDIDTEAQPTPAAPQETEHKPDQETESTPIQSPEDSKPETTDTSSQGTVDSDTKSQTEDQRPDEMEVEREVNGTPDSEPTEAKSVDAVIPTASPLTTSA